MQSELKGLGKGLADNVGAHLAAVALFIDDDPERAWAHAIAARRMAARLGVVRETAGLAAYRAGHYTDALAELRTARRMTGSNVHLPVMADSERGLGRPERALDLIRGDEAKGLDREGRIELAIVESGARTDLGQLEAAVVAVRLPELEAKDSRSVARLRYAYAEALRAVGRDEEGDDWHRRALVADRDGSADIPVVVGGDAAYAADGSTDLGEEEILDLEYDDDEDEFDEQEHAVDEGFDEGPDAPALENLSGADVETSTSDAGPDGVDAGTVDDDAADAGVDDEDDEDDEDDDDLGRPSSGGTTDAPAMAPVDPLHPFSQS